MTANDTAILVGAVSAAAATLITVLSTKGVDALVKFNTDRRVDAVRHDQDRKEGLEFIVEKYGERITALEADLCELHEQHNDCEKRHQALLVQVGYLEKELKRRGRRGQSAGETQIIVAPDEHNKPIP